MVDKVKIGRWQIILFGVAAISCLQAERGSLHSKPFPPSLTFNGKTYKHRWSNGDKHEFTPVGQDDLSSWVDMLTLWVDPRVCDGESLALEVDRVIARYQRFNGQNMNVFFIPKGSERLGEYFVSLRLGRAPVVEFVAARFVLHEMNGVGIIYSHRSYGPQASQTLIQWVESHGPELALVVLDLNPSDLLTAPIR